MGSAISKENKDFVNNNWNSLKCSPIGPFLQMLKVAPGDPTSTSESCQSNAFSSQFNSSMSDTFSAQSKLSDGLSSISNLLNSFRTVIANIQQSIFKALSQVATLIFTLYVKIGNILFVLSQQLVNILNIFKEVVNVMAAIGKLLLAFINLIRIPFNLMYDLYLIVKRIIGPLVALAKPLYSGIKSMLKLESGLKKLLR
tara:strand:- start:1617 stop:2213 length:597 start_codon:yes stop_codon:yes gene_type:complete